MFKTKKKHKLKERIRQSLKANIKKEQYVNKNIKEVDNKYV